MFLLHPCVEKFESILSLIKCHAVSPVVMSALDVYSVVNTQQQNNMTTPTHYSEFRVRHKGQQCISQHLYGILKQGRRMSWNTYQALTKH